MVAAACCSMIAAVLPARWPDSSTRIAWLRQAATAKSRIGTRTAAATSELSARIARFAALTASEGMPLIRSADEDRASVGGAGRAASSRSGGAPVEVSKERLAKRCEALVAQHLG